MEMVIQVDQELCTGCGTCVETCFHGAIQVWDQRAVIDHILCKQCEACMEVCPNRAIRIMALPVNRSPSLAVSPAEIHVVPAENYIVKAEMNSPKINLAPMASAALMFVGREVVPRLLDTLIGRVEQKLNGPATIAISGTYTASPQNVFQDKGKARRIRNRRRLNKHRNQKGRR